MAKDRLLFLGALAGAALVAAGAMLLLHRSGQHAGNAAANVLQTSTDQASLVAAESAVQGAVPAMEAYFSEHGSYAGATPISLRASDPGIDPSVTVIAADAQRYCLQSTVGSETASYTGPGGSVVGSPCA